MGLNSRKERGRTSRSCPMLSNLDKKPQSFCHIAATWWIRGGRFPNASTCKPKYSIFLKFHRNVSASWLVAQLQPSTHLSSDCTRALYFACHAGPCSSPIRSTRSGALRIKLLMNASASFRDRHKSSSSSRAMNGHVPNDYGRVSLTALASKERKKCSPI